MIFFEGYRVSSPFGWRADPFTGERAFHKGIDLVKEHRGPIYAFVAGEVVHAKEGVTGSGFGNYGIVVAVRDAAGSLHCYCHLDSAVVKVGQRIERGQMIGRQGSTGRSTGSHLHYEIRKTSSPSYGWSADIDSVYDPGEYLATYYAMLKEPTKKPADEVSEWAREAHEWAMQTGVSDGTRPKEAVTREEVWTMLWRAQARK